MKKERIFYIDFIKVISSILILVYHFYHYLEYYNITGIYKIFYYTINGTSNGAVALNGLASFFIVSGVALMYRYSEKIDYKEYAFKRFKTIFPMFWICYIFAYLYDYFISEIRFAHPIGKFLLTIIGLDGYFMYLSPNFYLIGEWFLGVMIFLYILFPLSRKIIKKNKKIATIVIIFLAVLTEAILYFYPFSVDYKRNMIVCFFLFILGIYFAEYIKEIKWYKAIVALIVYIIFRTVNFHIEERIIVYIPATLSFFILVYFSKFITNIKVKKVFEIMSKYTYPIFLVHSFVIKKVLVQFEGSTFTNIEGIGIFLLILVIIAIVSKLLYELTIYITKKVPELIKKNKTFLLNNLPFIVYAILMVPLHIKMNIRADDVTLIKMFEQNSLIEWICIRYTTWSSRIIIDAFMMIMLKSKYIIWKILNIVMFTLLPYSINKLFNNTKDIKFKWIICIVTLLIPWTCFGEAGWAATSINYIWVLVFGILSCIPIKKNFKNEKLSITEIIISLVSLIIASDHEQMVVILAILYGITLIHNFIKKKKNVLLYCYMVIILLSIILILASPGNYNRIMVEAENRFPIYQNFNFINKIEVGFTSMMRFIILEKSLLFFTTTLIIMFTVFITNRSKFFRTVSIIQFIGSISLNSINKIIPNNLIFIKDTINNFNAGTLISGLFKENNIFAFYCMFIYYIVILASMIISLYAIFKNTYKSAFAITIFSVGIISRVILGFSPTVYDSGERISTFLYASFLILTIYIWKYLRSVKKENKVINITLIILCLISYVQNYINIINLH